MDTVYVETTVIGHLTGRDHLDPVIAARQMITRKWWTTTASDYRLIISEVVVNECSAGDTAAAEERLAAIQSVEVLIATEAVLKLADNLIDSGAVPSSQPRDAFHIAISAVNGVQYLVTWNFKHIANPALQKKIASVCRDNGFDPPVICTPEQLLEAENGS